MSKQSEQERKKQFLRELREKEKQEFELRLPMSRKTFGDLFDYLDAELENNSCDDTLKLTENFLKANNIQDIAAVKEWLAKYGGNCDCEVLANVEERFDS